MASYGAGIQYQFEGPDIPIQNLALRETPCPKNWLKGNEIEYLPYNLGQCSQRPSFVVAVRVNGIGFTILLVKHGLQEHHPFRSRVFQLAILDDAKGRFF